MRQVSVGCSENKNEIYFEAIDKSGVKENEIDAIAFSFGKRVEDLKDGQKVDLAYYLELNKFNGQEKLQFKIIDIKLI